MKNKSLIILFVLCFGALAVAQANKPAASNVVTLNSTSPLYEIKIMIRAGSVNDPKGKEGTSSLVANALLEAGFGDKANPVTKEKVAEITRPWGDAATPSVLVDKQATTFSMIVPRDSFSQFVNQILRPMFNQPLWIPAEVDRLRREALVGIQSRLRLENQENLGLQAIESYIFQGTPMENLSSGTVQGLKAITPEDLQSFFRAHYRQDNMFIASTISDPADQRLLMEALPAANTGVAGPAGSSTIPPRPQFTAPAIEGRELLIVTQPNAIASGIHAGFPIQVNRAHPDYWPLYVANVFLGTHRDSFGRLYTYIREQRGYNYGDYSYIEFLFGRPFFLFPPPTTPREQQYFSIWIRPVGHEYVHFLTKAFMFELDRLVREGLTPEQVAEAKIKARTLYLNFAESKERQLGYRLDDLFYGMSDRGYLQNMLRNVDAVTPEQVNAAIKRHLQTQNVKFIIATKASEAEKLANDIATNTNITSKTNAQYNIPDPITPDKQELLDRDKQWKAYELNIPRERIRIVSSDQMFETTAIPAAQDAAGGAR